MDKFFIFFSGFFQGKQSMTRLVLLIATLLLWGPWAYTTIVSKKPQPLDYQVVTAYALVLGGKTAQNYFDKKSEKGSVPTIDEPK